MVADGKVALLPKLFPEADERVGWKLEMVGCTMAGAGCASRGGIVGGTSSSTPSS